MRKGIAAGGTMLVDNLKTVSSFPRQHELVKITHIGQALGGAVNNVLADLARLDGEMPLYAVGRIGRDGEGDLNVRELSAYPNIDISGIICEDRTSFTDVLVEGEGKSRTFLVFPGASAHLDVEDFDFDRLNCRMLHMGYILLLDTLDMPDPQYGTRMARLLHDAQSHGILTSVDVVSEVGDRYQKLVPPALKYTDYLIINELEAGKTCGIELRTGDGGLNRAAMEEALRTLRAMGVKKWVMIHAPEGSWGLDENDRFVEKTSLRLPEGFIQGTVGAGDAFCAGALLAAYNGESMETAMEDGAAAAACSLRKPGASEGVGSLAEARNLARELGFR